jgi:hypothetical protein
MLASSQSTPMPRSPLPVGGRQLHREPPAPTKWHREAGTANCWFAQPALPDPERGRVDQRRSLRSRKDSAAPRCLATLWHILVSVARRFLTGWVATISPRIRQPGSGGRAELGRANMRGSGTCPTAARQRIALLPSSPSLAVVSKRNSRDSSSRLTSSAGDQLSPVQVSTLG